MQQTTGLGKMVFLSRATGWRGRRALSGVSWPAAIAAINAPGVLSCRARRRCSARWWSALGARTCFAAICASTTPFTVRRWRRRASRWLFTYGEPPVLRPRPRVMPRRSTSGSGPAGLYRRHPRARGAAGRLDDRRQRRDQAALPAVPGDRRRLLPAAEAGAVGRARFHRPRSRRQPAAVRRARGRSAQRRGTIAFARTSGGRSAAAGTRCASSRGAQELQAPQAAIGAGRQRQGRDQLDEALL